MAGKFVLKTAKDGQFYFVLEAGNGQVILTSEMYVAKASAENGIASVRKNAGNDALYERKEQHGGHAMFNLKAANHQVVGTSQGYSSTAARDAGIESVKASAEKAELEDLAV
ncbi:MAG TPA: YegP family protein [Edaphobacter sp.]|nr:YegP family protein [Edaphobacter sp.]